MEKMKFRKFKDRKIVRVGKIRVGKCTDQKNMEKFRNDYNLEIGLGFCR